MGSSRSFRTERRRTASASIGNRYPAFPQESIGGEVTGSTRVSQGLIEICNLSRGYGRTSDSLLGLVQDTSDEFELTVDVEGLEGFGEAGVEARVFGGTGSDPSQAVVRISLQSDAVGIGFVLSSGVRSRRSASMDSTVAAPVPVQLPVRIGIERSGNEITTFFFEGPDRVDHFSVHVEPDSSLHASTYRVEIVHGSQLGAQQPRSGTARFSHPNLERQQSVEPPQLSNHVGNSQGTIDQPTILTITGSRLADTVEGRSPATRP